MCFPMGLLKDADTRTSVHTIRPCQSGDHTLLSSSSVSVYILSFRDVLDSQSDGKQVGRRVFTQKRSRA